MKRKTIAILAVVICIALCCVSLAACKTNVKGKTYAYEKYEIIWDADITAEDRADYEEYKDVVVALYKEVTISFDKAGAKGKVNGFDEEGEKSEKTFAYEEKEDKIVITVAAEETGDEDAIIFTVDGKSLMTEVEIPDIGIWKIYFKISK